MIFGSHTPSHGANVPPMAICSNTRPSIIYPKQRAMPKPMCIPIPPRTLREASDTPMMVRMKVEKGYEKRVCRSTSMINTLSEPLRRCCVRKSFIS